MHSQRIVVTGGAGYIARIFVNMQKVKDIKYYNR